jgi:hypothetical protein
MVMQQANRREGMIEVAPHHSQQPKRKPHQQHFPLDGDEARRKLAHVAEK